MQTAIIIGATSGIGQELAVRFTDIRPGFVATEILGAEHNYPFIMPVGADDLHQDTIAH